MLLEINQVHKSFGAVAVLKDITLTLDKGQLLGLVGENGAGKSTLMNIIGGQFSATSGELFLEGRPFAPTTPREAMEAGIAFIHQELNLFPNLSVKENLFLHDFPRKKIAGMSFIDQATCKRRAVECLAEVGLDVAPDSLVEGLTTAERQMVEIAKALISKPKLIILDEPTTSLTSHETQKLFELISRLKQAGTAMIYISHNLDEVCQLADRIVVMRDGRVVKNEDRKKGYDTRQLINEMVGRDISQLFTERKRTSTNREVLRIVNLKAGKKVQGVSFRVNTGEIVGLYGLVGAGRSETARLIFGLDRLESGEIFWNGIRVNKPAPRHWIKSGVGFLTEDRREEGLLLPEGIQQNIRLTALRRFATRALGTLDFTSAAYEAEKLATATRMKYNSLSGQPVSTLSGGNQQKVVLSKWLLTDPHLLIMDEPTKGIDVGAKHEIYILINDLVEKGASVLLISSEIEELIGLCDRIVVLSEGKTKGEFKRGLFNRADLLAAALHN